MSLNRQVFNGAILMVLLRFFVKFLGLISTLVLVRFLSPEDFGIVAIVMSIYALIEMLKSFGFDVILIQKQSPTPEMYHTTWTIQVVFGLLSFVIMYLSSPYIAMYFDDQRIELLAQVVALLFVIAGLSNIGTVNFRKHLDYKREFIFVSIPKVIAVIATISLAIRYESYWALVGGMFVMAFFKTILSFIMSTFRPRICLSEFRSLFSFSSWLVLNGILNYVNMRSKDLLVGKMLGAQQTGTISIADEIASLPTTEMVAAVNRATYPGYAKVSHDNVKLKSLFLNALSFIALLGIPSSLGISLSAPVLVPFALGEKWVEVVPFIQVLGIAYAVMCINSNASYIFLAKGKPKTNTLVNLARAILMLSLMLILINFYGLIGVPIAILITTIIMFPSFYYLLKREMGLTFIEYIAVLWRPAISGMIMYATLYMGFIQNNVQYSHLALTLLAIISAGICIFIISMVFLWVISGRSEGVEKIILNKIQEKINKRQNV